MDSDILLLLFWVISGAVWAMGLAVATERWGKRGFWTVVFAPPIVVAALGAAWWLSAPWFTTHLGPSARKAFELAGQGIFCSAVLVFIVLMPARSDAYDAVVSFRKAVQRFLLNRRQP